MVDDAFGSGRCEAEVALSVVVNKTAEELQRKVESLSHENAELRGKNESLLKERDFYFDKLVRRTRRKKKKRCSHRGCILASFLLF